MNEPEVVDIAKILRRRMCWDIIPCEDVEATLSKHGLVPGSEEGNEIEHLASHRRLDALAPINQWLTLTSRIAGEVLGTAILESHGNGPMESNSEQQRGQYVQLVMAGAQAVMASLLDQGVVRINHEGVVL